MDALQGYRKKRNFARTPEPSGSATQKRRRRAGAMGAYVIQKHAARALHYDLRLELDGVFKSWAVPKGAGLVAGEKHLAVQVEDHPLEYGDFEGVIPKGEYGGGTVMLWDRGEWRAETVSDLDAGKLDFVLDGNKLKGAWTLVRMGGKKNADGRNWLLIKRHDAGAQVEAPSDVSVTTGRSMDEIARARDRTWTRDGEEPPKRAARRRKTPTPARLNGSVRKSKIPAFFAPQLATLVPQAPAGPNWIHEIKFDGYRIIARLERGKVRLFSRNGKDWTSRFSEIADSIAQIRVGSAIFDGEVVALSPNGASRFGLLQNALSSEHTASLVYQAFDLLHLDRYDLTGVAQIDRKRALEALLKSTRFDGDVRVRYTDHIVEKGPEFFQQVCNVGLEGIISKAADAPYREGRGRSWLKSKCTQHEDLVIGGYTDPAGSRTGFGALLLGAFEADGTLTYMGRVGTGFDGRELAQIAARLKKLSTTRSPFGTPLPERGVRWVRPRLVAEVEFTERTRDGLLRHPSFRGLREDKDPKETATPNPTVSTTAPAALLTSDNSKRSRSKTNNDSMVAGVKLTHPERVLWPEHGVTKLDLARYYEAIEPWLMRSLMNRPLALLRCPDGLTGACFFQKHPGETMSEEIPRVPIRERDKVSSYMYVQKISDVIRLVQMGVLELHVWGSHVDDLERPDLMVFDLDPDPELSWGDVIRGAKQLRERLDAIKLASFPRITGGKGMHVVVPLKPSADWDTVKAFSLAIAQSLELEHPMRFTTNMAKAKRRGKIFIDYLRNGRGATAISSYSTRAREGAPIAVPIRWDELTTAMKPDRYDLNTVQKRLKTLREDPWHAFEESRRPLVKARSRPSKRKSRNRT